jgi:hypothetical protein
VGQAKKPQEAKAKLDTLRRRVKTLAILQEELRRALNNYFDSNSTNAAGFAKQIKAGYIEVVGFVNRDRSMCGGKILKKTTNTIGRSDLRSEIEVATMGLADRWLGWSSLPSEVVSLGFDLMEQSQVEAPRLTQTGFSSLFGENALLVQRVLGHSAKALREIEANPSVLKNIQETIMADDWDERLVERYKQETANQITKGKILSDLVNNLKSKPPNDGTTLGFILPLGIKRGTFQYAVRGMCPEATIDTMIEKVRAYKSPQNVPQVVNENTKVGKGKQLRGLVHELKPKVGNRETVAKELNVSIGVLKHAMRGSTTNEKLDVLLKKAEKLLGRYKPNEALTTPTLPTTPTKSGHQKVSPKETRDPASGNGAMQIATRIDLGQILSQLGGETSAKGVRFVLGEASFKQVDLEPSEAFIAQVVQSIEIARGLLNVCAQVKDRKIRDGVQDFVLPQVEELERTLKAFKALRPKDLMSALTANRRTETRGSKSTPKGTRR